MSLCACPELLDFTLYHQGFVLDPGANALGVVVSNALESNLGMR